MTPSKCGCSTQTCGCCEGTRKITPVSTANRPGLDQLNYRIGTHGAFFETMQARLANMTVEAPGVDGQTIEKFYPLQALTTRDSSDPAIALLDSWATVGDVLTFYQERIANEGYLRTATEYRSLIELSRLVGYKARPGVAATVFLAYTLEDTQVDPVEIPAGARSQSIPGPDELPQSFETSDDLLTRREWNNLQVRLQQPQNITLENAVFIEKLYVAGINTNLKTGDTLLLVFGATGDPAVLRTVTSIATQFEQNRTEIALQPLDAKVAAAVHNLNEFVKSLEPLKAPPGSQPNAADTLSEAAASLLTSVRMGVPDPLKSWVERFPTSIADPNSDIGLAITSFQRRLNAIVEPSHQVLQTISVTSPAEFVPKLLKARITQPASSLRLDRNLRSSFENGKDTPAQLLVNMVPELKDTFYTAWNNATLSDRAPDLQAVYVLRTQVSLFGANVPDQPTFFTQDEPNENPVHIRGELKPPDQWTKWPLALDERENVLFLDQAHDDVLPLSYAMVQTGSGSVMKRHAFQVTNVETVQRTAYGLTAKTTRLTLADPWQKIQTGEDVSTLRQTLVYAQSEQLTLVDEPITTNVQVTKENAADGIVLDGLYSEFPSGRWVILSGERTDIPNVTGVNGTELLMVSGLRQVDPEVAGDTIHTALLLATPTAYSYKRATLKIYGNVVKATHGETTDETLGSGDGSKPMQSFDLKQPPLTFVSAPTAAGVDSTLKVYVNNVEWHETDALFDLGPRDRKFITKTDDKDKTTIIFGNGKQGSRLPTGVLNVTSAYRRGIGKPGNVKPEQVSLLQTKPLGVKSVINPLRASGGADKEDTDQIRENTPLAVMALDRLVSLQDYSDFTRTFAGIGKASGVRLTDGFHQFIHLTIAGADDIPIDPESDLYRNLNEALAALGDVTVAVRIDARELITLVLSAKIHLEPDYLWDPVAAAVRDALFATFGFRKRALGQPALLCEVIECIQSVEGVGYVDVDAFGGVPERVSDEDGTRRLQTLEEISDTVAEIVSGSGNDSKPANAVLAGLAEFENGAVVPARLAILASTVPDTVVLNQIK